MEKLSPFSKPKPPRWVTIMGYRIRVKLVKTLTHEGQEMLGLYLPDRREILLLDHAGWPEILFHELIHCALDLTAANEGMSEEAEERVVRALTSALFPLV
jgi:hypothetical protein